MFETVVFAGTGSNNPSLLMWTHPHSTAEPQTVSRFPRGYSIYGLAVSPNGTRVAAGTKGGLIRVLGLIDGKATVDSPALFEVFHPPAVVSLAFCTDDILASGGLDGRIRLWSISEGRQLSEIQAHQGGVFALCRIGSLVLASIGADAVLRVWDLDSLEARFESEPFDLPGIQALVTIDYNPTTGLLVHPSQTGMLHLYNVKEGFTRRTIKAHEGDFTAISYGTQYVATGGTYDAMLKVWSLSLDKCLMQASAVTGILSLGWAGTDTLLTAYRDGSGQTWQIRDSLSAGFRHAGLDLRFVTGLPIEQLARSQAWIERQWRDAKVEEAKELLSQPEQRGRLTTIVRDLYERGFSAESVLILADAARSQQQSLWELESLLALVKGLGDSPASVPCLYALAVLLENMKEHKLALQYFEAICRIDKGHRDVEHHISSLKASPFLRVSPDQCVLGDSMHKDLFTQELRKNTLLYRRFRSRVLVRAGNPMHLPATTNIQEMHRAIMEALQGIGVNAHLASLQQLTLLRDSALREITWLYIPSAVEPRGAAFAMEIRTPASGMECVPCAVFDATLIEIPPDVSVEEHNDRVQDAWIKFNGSPATTGWLRDAHRLALKSLARLEGRIMADTDDEY
jgi:hypothetical protein